ncbi:hypothetical protein ACP4OV_000956 [Aristida adscensionis]
MDSSEDLEGQGRKALSFEPVIPGLPSLEEIDSSDEDMPPLLRAFKANKTKKVVRRLEQWEIDAALALDVSDYVPREIPRCLTGDDYAAQALKAIHDEVTEVKQMVREYNRQYQKLIREEYEARGYVDMEFTVCVDDFVDDKINKKREDKDEKAR